VGGFKGFMFSVGEFYILIATIFWAIETVLAKKILPNVDSDILTAARMGIGATVLLIISAILEPTALKSVAIFNYTQWLWVAITVITLFGYVSIWYRSLKYANATTVTAILVLSTLVTNILSALFITHRLNFQIILQSIVLVFGMIILLKSRFLNAERISYTEK
jgi:drug/metabolite transporter (DMT)-like permease